jgi:hypothetical protein
VPALVAGRPAQRAVIGGFVVVPAFHGSEPVSHDGFVILIRNVPDALCGPGNDPENVSGGVVSLKEWFVIGSGLG